MTGAAVPGLTVFKSSFIITIIINTDGECKRLTIQWPE